MPVNWSLLNPSLPAQAQTINPFAALNAGRAQAEERIQNQQAGELRGLQIEGAKRTAEQDAKKRQVRQVLAQWREASDKGDQAAADAALQTAKGLDLALVQETVAEIEKEEIEGQTRQTQLRTQQAALADKNAPLVIAAAAAEDKTPGAGKAMMQAAGAWNEEVHGPIWGDRTNRERMVQAAENMPSVREQRAKAEKARQDAANEAARLANDNRRTSAYVANQGRDPTQTPDQTARDMARFDTISAKPEGRRTPAEKLFMERFRRAAQGEPTGADLYMNPTPQADASARGMMGNDPELKDFASDAAARAVFWAAYVRGQRQDGLRPTEAARRAKEEVLAGIVGAQGERWYERDTREFRPTGPAAEVLEFVRDANGNIVPKGN
jgi:hypothetical protein